MNAAVRRDGESAGFILPGGNRMRSRLCYLAAVLAACGSGSKAPAADTAAAAAPVLGPAALVLSDLAGKWLLSTTPEGRDTTITADLIATATTEGWTMATRPSQSPVSLRVRVDGDSLTLEAGPFASAVRQGTTVSTTSVLRVQDDKLVGSLVARYSGPGIGADSVMRGRQEASRIP